MKRIKTLILVFALVLFNSCSEGKKDTMSNSEPQAVSNKFLNRVEPPNWWVGFNNPELQLLVHEPGIGKAEVEVSYPGVELKDAHKARSLNYLFIDLEINSNARAGKFDLVFKFESGEEKVHTYELKEREQAAADFIGFNSSDAIFLITPDRFANSDPSNDSFEDLKQVGIDRTHDYKRHGGDIKGVIDHLDYIDELGYTAIWPCPLLINDMPQGSYHGYAITDLYRIDPRFGQLNDYLELSEQLRGRGMKLIMDQVANHCGLEHWWMKDLPFDDWVNNQKRYEENKDNWNWENTKFSNHRRTTNQDLYASEIDKQGMTDGWFVDAMPDLNQRNPFMAKYLIQNSIWWIETAKLGGIRQDTYPYPDKDFMSEWAGSIMNEYPNFNIVGEEWSYNPLLIAYWQKGANNKDGYDSNLRSTMDFAMQRKVVEAINEEESWDKGLVKIYEGLANDFIYPSPRDIMVFPDNHDMSRIHTQLNEDFVNTKMALATFATLPRTLQMYYGTEILMNDTAKPGDHGLIRTDFPGGWEGDLVNAFTGKGLTKDQKEMQQFMKAVLNFRKSSEAIHNGQTIHFAPENGTYVLARIIDAETVVLILNKNEQPVTLDLNRFAEIGLKGKSLKNIISGESFSWGEEIRFEGRGVTLLTTNLD
ncbi:MAG: glycoside hydrolase family 13 protein [Flavobacteriaceae bacterium]|nr:glycoside hydrolase family 13 protein [Bacteroidia bacterium]MBT8286561.1 glycoside hydrolase family 13 protein [Bacteroidia bacterium]NNF74450.1 glycoside hydrolase family 13 protein [Flavobacteriaceae bacterium]NNK73955.1 glycoside hydrolase family 13 protein [Flavobacteriaceae bacterium]